MIATLAMLAAIIVPVPAVIKSMKDRVTPFRAVINGVIYGTLGALVVMVIGQMMGVNAFDELFSAVDSIVKIMAENPGMTEMMGDDLSKEEMIKTLTYVYESSIKLLPGCMVMIALFASYFEYILLSKIIKTDGIAAIPMTKMQELDLPRRFITFWFVIYIAAMILSRTDMMADSIIFMNLNMLLDIAFSLQGLSVIFMFCHTRRIPRVVPAIIMVLVMLFGVGRTIVMLLGFTDLLFGLKYRMKQKF